MLLSKNIFKTALLDNTVTRVPLAAIMVGRSHQHSHALLFLAEAQLTGLKETDVTSSSQRPFVAE